MNREQLKAAISGIQQPGQTFSESLADRLAEQRQASSTCTDHFVGANDLRCHTCGWNAATRSYD